MTPARTDPPRWHQALAYAVTGERYDWLGAQALPDVPRLVAELRTRWSAEALSGHVRDARAEGRPWPHPVAADLMTGLSPAQLSAALTEVVAQLGVDRPRPARASRSTEPVSAVERRLRDEVPPHHGS